jgi:Zn finger protein HypA/HybF involved in hydrogenase expression
MLNCKICKKEFPSKKVIFMDFCPKCYNKELKKIKEEKIKVFN